MKTLILIFHAVSALLLVLCILAQSQGVGLSATFGGEGGFYATKRGVEKTLFYLTVLFAVVFVGTALVYIIA